MFDMIGYACGAGAQHQECEKAPGMLRNFGLSDFLRHFKLPVKWQPLYHIKKQLKARKRPLSKLARVARYCRHLSTQVCRSAKAGHLPVIVGGDHSMAIGSWNGIAKANDCHGQLGLLWFDAHMDAHTPHTSPSGAYHGMPLACLLGYGHKSLVHIGGKTPALHPNHVCLIGVRSFENPEAMLLQSLGVRIFFMEEVEALGWEQTITQALNIVSLAPGGFGISFDIDVLDPSIAPGTGSKEKHGLHLEDALEMLKYTAHHHQLKGMEIAEYHPMLDDQRHTTAKVVAVMLKTVLMEQQRYYG